MVSNEEPSSSWASCLLWFCLASIIGGYLDDRGVPDISTQVMCSTRAFSCLNLESCWISLRGHTEDCFSIPPFCSWHVLALEWRGRYGDGGGLWWARCFSCTPGVGGGVT